MGDLAEEREMGDLAEGMAEEKMGGKVVVEEREMERMEGEKGMEHLEVAEEREMEGMAGKERGKMSAVSAANQATSSATAAPWIRPWLRGELGRPRALTTTRADSTSWRKSCPKTGVKRKASMLNILMLAVMRSRTPCSPVYH